MTVIDFQKAREEAQPHMHGKAKCLACGNEEMVVAPIGVVQPMECSKCGLTRSWFRYPIVKEWDVWTCPCGCDLFHITRNGAYCPNCGQWQNWDKEGR